MRLAADHKDVAEVGPRTSQECQDWCADVVRRAVASNMGMDWLAGVEEVHVTCKWAGLAGMPIAFSYLTEEIDKHPDLPNMAVKFHSFTDYDKHCQGVG